MYELSLTPPGASCRLLAALSPGQLSCCLRGSGARLTLRRLAAHPRLGGLGPLQKSACPRLQPLSSLIVIAPSGALVAAGLHAGARMVGRAFGPEAVGQGPLPQLPPGSPPTCLAQTHTTACGAQPGGPQGLGSREEARAPGAAPPLLSFRGQQGAEHVRRSGFLPNSLFLSVSTTCPAPGHASGVLLTRQSHPVS